jgi:hypothetical protein
MRSLFTLLLLAGLLPLSGFSQLNNGGLYARFGVDADTRSNYMKYGLTTGPVASDDWFSPSMSGYNVIDTSNAAYYLPLLQSGANLSFNKRMSVPLYSKVGGKLWLDAAYGRDFTAAASLKDSTTFTFSCKNGDNPSSWAGGVSSFPDKNDLVDVYAHMRRDGISVHDSLWLFTGVSTFGTSGSHYFDIELYKKSFTYNSATGAFSTAGTSFGHTEWLFDASGNLTQTGDMILAVTFSPGSAPVVDVRIWVSQSTHNTVIPADFSFNSSFDGSTPSYGYASIVSKTGNTAFGAGISNYTASGVQDTTYATPWGSTSNSGWSALYQSEQLIEIGLNLTRIGIDPALYTALGSSACQSLFSNIFFKSRSSGSFTANMQDFVYPLVFLRDPVMDYTLTPDTLRCNRTTGTIQLTSNTTAGYYTWQTPNGNITGSNTDSSQLSINKPGTYIISASPAEGCPTTRKDTVVIPIDTFPPVASINMSLVGSFNHFQFYGGDVNASNYATPFGGSQGLLWDWSGPKAFSSTIQNPATADTAWGTYQLIVTEKRNGCKDTALKTVNIWDFSVLLGNELILTGNYADNANTLLWSDQNQALVEKYEIEKFIGKEFSPIGTKYTKDRSGNSGSTLFYFTDHDPVEGANQYRVRAITGDGHAWYSAIVSIVPAGKPSFFVTPPSPAAAMTLVAITGMASNGTIAIYSVSGQLLYKRNVRLIKGSNSFELPASGLQAGNIQVITLFINGRAAYTQKVMR